MTASSKSSRREDFFDRPLDATLERLRVLELPYRPHFDRVDTWIASCPIDGEELTLVESYIGAPVGVRCSGSCHESRIIAALAAEPHRYDPGLDLAEEASEVARRALDLLEQSCQ